MNTEKRIRSRSHTIDGTGWDWHVQRLESRRMLAGNVTAVVAGATLNLTGDALSNDVVLSTNNGQLELSSGDPGTNITLQGNLAGVRRINWDTGRGDDTIRLDGIDLAQSISIVGTGSHDIVMRDVRIGGSLSVNGGGAGLNVTFSQADVAGRTTLATADGDSTIFVDGDTHLRRQLRVRLNGSGTRSLTVADAQLHQGVTYVSQGGNVTTRLVAAALINRQLVTQVFAGQDDFRMQDQASVTGSVKRTTVDGNSSTVMTDESSVTGLLSARTINGTSHVELIDDSYAQRFRGSGSELIRNVTYVTRESGPLAADVYVPTTAGPHPAVLVIHGGGWRSGSKSNMSSRARALADRGYVAVSINYRHAPAHPFPAQIHDAKAAVAWMRQHAADYQIDPDRIGTYGFSAGGHLALLVGVTDGSEGLEDPDALSGVSTRVQAVIAGGPGTDFRNVHPDSEKFSYLFGGTRNEVPQAYQAASPAHWLSPDDPPTMVFVGERDGIINRENVDAFVQDLAAHGITHDFYEAAGKGHVASIRDASTLRESLQFLDATLKS